MIQVSIHRVGESHPKEETEKSLWGRKKKQVEIRQGFIKTEPILEHKQVGIHQLNYLGNRRGMNFRCKDQEKAQKHFETAWNNIKIKEFGMNGAQQESAFGVPYMLWDGRKLGFIL